MARGSSNPMQEHHRKQRQKEVQKNKQQRLKARDEKVVETKTIQQVQEEIRTIEKRKKQHSKLQVSEEQKLQRLQKELKLLQEADEKKRKAEREQQESSSQRYQSKYQELKNPLNELDDPRKSIYYDERFNPYGAPPPGKPRLYHQRGGGITMDVRWAVVPGEEPPPPPPPRPPQSHFPPPRMPQQSTSSQSTSASQHEPKSLHLQPPTRHEDSTTNRISSKVKVELTANTPVEASRKPSETENEQEETTRNNNQSFKEKNNEKSSTSSEKAQLLAAPALPPPSEAVQRTQRLRKNRAAIADIWASTEEVEYERQAHQIDLEANDWGNKIKSKKKKKKKVPLEYYYQDRIGQVQGPFQKSQMKQWLEAGYFPAATTLVKTTRNEEWIPIGEVPSLQQQSEPSIRQQSNNCDESDIQNRIAALKRDLHSENSESNKAEEADPVQARIAALKAQNGNHSTTNNNEQNSDGEESRSSLQDRIAALKGDRIGANQAQHLQQGNEEPVASYPTNDVDGVAPYPVDDQETSAYPVDEESGDLPYPVEDADDDNQDDSYPTPQAYPVADGEASSYLIGDNTDEGVAAIAPYPVDEDDAIGPYPVDEPYPDGDDVAYPVTDSYVSMDAREDYDGQGPAYAEAISYPPPAVDKEALANHTSSIKATKKKVVKVDKELVAFLPSHLQNKKRKPKGGSRVTSSVPRPAKRSKPAAANLNSTNNNDKVDDDYDKLMQEVDRLE